MNNYLERIDHTKNDMGYLFCRYLIKNYIYFACATILGINIVQFEVPEIYKTFRKKIQLAISIISQVQVSFLFIGFVLFLLEQGKIFTFLLINKRSL